MFAGLALLPGSASAYTPIDISADLPSFSAKSAVVPFTLTVTGGPGGDGVGNFTFKSELSAKNKTGAAITPTSGTSNDGVWKLNLTLPGEPGQTLKITINATSKNPKTAEIAYKEREFEVIVVDPIVISVTVYNTGDVGVENATARFYADGTLLAEQTFDVPAKSSKNLAQNWTWLKISDGKHVVTVKIDDPNGIVEFSDGNNVYSQVIYVGDQGNPIGGILTIGILVMAFFLGLTLMTKPSKRRKP